VVVTSPLASVRLVLVETLDDAFELKRWLGERRDILGVDTETGGLSPYHCGLRLVQLGDMKTGWSIPWPLWGGFIQEIFTRYEGEYVLHNSSFDYRFLSIHAGIQMPWHKVHDTMTLATLDDPIRRRDLKGLSTLLIDRFATAGEQALKEGMHKNKWDWATVPYTYPAYWAYAALDPVLTCHLYSHLHPRVIASSPDVYDLERGIIRVCTNMMLHGMRIDRSYIHEGITRLRDFSGQAREWLEKSHGITSPLAHRQVAKALEDAGVVITKFTATGSPQMDKEVLSTIRDSSPIEAARGIAKYVLGVRKAEKVIGAYLENFLEMADSNDLIHCSIHPMQARTGRMAISSPALQTLHRDDKVVRGAFVPHEGNAFISIDASQIEARIAAILSNDRGMIQAFQEADAGGADFFSGVASEIWGEPVSKKDNRRQLTKNTVYGSLYGAGAEKMSQTAKVPVEVMAPVKDAFNARYPGLQQLMGQVTAAARAQVAAGEIPHVRTAMGRYLPGEQHKLYALTNYLIQSTAAETLKKGILDLDAAGLGEYLRLPVHDEVISEVPASDAEEILRTTKKVLDGSTEYELAIPWSGEIMTERWSKE
jgi:DNA polymerase I